jgi:carboxyl-terminal processing protease
MELMKKGVLSILACLLLLLSCDDQNVSPDNAQAAEIPDIGSEAESIPEWIYEEMSYFYYWNNALPATTPSGDEDPENYFAGLLKADDRFSYISDDAEAIKEEITGTIVAMGFSSAYGVFSNSNNLFAVVEYVYGNSPAANAGLKRGDIILQVDGENLTQDNFNRLSQNTDFSVTLGEYDGSYVRLTDEVINLTGGTIELDPVIHHEVKEVEGRKIGYMVYVDFLAGENDKWLNSLKAALSDLKSAGISEMVLDLRYNTGGEVSQAIFLSSALAPIDVVTEGRTLVEYTYNDNLEGFFLDRQGESSPNLVSSFVANDYNLNLTDLYVLTTRSTASASELLINGLKPHMNVVQIGESTFGKFYGSYVLYDQSEPPKHNWAIVPVVLKYVNANGEGEFVNGLAPDVPLLDNILEARPFGDINDPMLNAALVLATGGSLSGSKLAGSKPYTPIYDVIKIERRNVQLFQFNR